MPPQVPTIKGIFVNSHIKAIRRKLGEEGIRDLEKRFGKPITFRNSDNIPVFEEIILLEHTLDMLAGNANLPETRAFDAGRLHFENFSHTPIARIIFSAFPDRKQILFHAKHVAEYVFRGITFSATSEEPDRIIITMEGGFYPLDHFKGFFSEWMKSSGHEPNVHAYQDAPEKYRYMLFWKKDDTSLQ